MSELSIAQQIANKRLHRRKLLKLAQGHQSRPNVSAAKPAATSVGGLNSSAATTGVAAGRGSGANLPRANRFQAPAAKKTLFAPEQSVGGAFVSGLGQGVGNMLGGVADFGRGTARYIAAPLAAEIGRATHSDRAAGNAYADDMYDHALKARGDVLNSFGRYVGVYDGRAPSVKGLQDQVNFISGPQYHAAQPADATKQHTQEIGQKYFGDTRSSTLGRAYTAANTLGDGAAEAIPLAMAGPTVGAQLMQRVPGAAAVARAASSNPFIRRTLTYGTGLPVSAPARPGLFLASNMGQTAAPGLINASAQFVDGAMRGAGSSDESRAFTRQMFESTATAAQKYLPANFVDNATRETVGDFAPELFDAMRWGSNTPVKLLAAGRPLLQTSVEKAEYGAEQKQLAAEQSASLLGSLKQQVESSATPDIVNQLDDNSHSQLLSLRSALEGKSVEEQIPLMQQMHAILAGAGPQNQPALDQQNAAAPFSAPVAETSAQPQQTESPEITQPDTAAAVAQALPPDATPEMRAEVDSGVAAVTASIEQDPELPARLQAEGGVEEFNKANESNAIEQIANERMQETPPPADNPRDWGQWFEETMSWATDAWNNLGFVGKLAFGLGMPLGVIGLLGGGLSGVLTAALGFGVAGLAAASTGAFGETAQGAVAGAGEAVAAAGEAVTGTGAPAAPVEPAVPLAQDESLKLVQELAAAPDGTQYIAQNRDKFNQFAAMSDADLSSVAKQMAPESRATVNKILTGLKTQVDTGIADVGGLWPSVADNWPGTREKLDSVGLKSTSELPALQEKINRMLQVLNVEQQEVAAPTGEKKSMFNSKSASHIVAQHLAITTLQKAARCWSGYEPVPGKKPYSNDSCRPVGGKKKKKKDKAAK